MERLVIYDDKELEIAPLYELAKDPGQLLVGQRPHSLTTETADETATIIAIFTGSRVTRAVLQRMPHLKLVMCLSTGFNHVDLAECHKRGITVCNVPGYGADTVAEYTIGLLLSLSRRLPETIGRLREGRAEHQDLVGIDLAGKTLTVIGTGRIGQNVIRLANAFKMKVLGSDPYPNTAAAKELGYTNVGLHDGLKRADVVSLHAPLTADNKHLINKHSLSIMKPGALLINTARGELIDTTALLHALHTGHLGGAALDVIEAEDLLGGRTEARVLSSGQVKHEVVRDIAEHEALLRLPNVIITNHNAFNTHEAHARITDTAIETIRAFRAGQPINVVK
jgi:D-lactate dehydrogenase